MERLKNNWKWKLASLIFGFFLWSYVTAGVNPTQEMVLRDVPLELRNQQMLTQKDYMITRADPGTVTLTVTGKRNALGDLQASDIAAVVDLAEFEEGNQSFPIRYETPGDIQIVGSSSERVSIAIEKIVSRSVNVIIEEEGQLGDNYILESVTATPQTVEITGARSRVDSVDHLVAKIDVSGMTEDRSSNIKIIPVTKDKEEVNNVTLSLSSVNVALAILKQKEVGITPQLEGDLPEDIALKKVQLTPNSILVKGKKAYIDNLERIHTESIDQSLISDDYSSEVDLNFPDGIQSVNGSASTELKITVEKKEERNIEIPVSQIKILNPPDGAVVKFANENAVLKVTVKGFPSELEGISAADLDARIDLEGKALSGNELAVSPRISSSKEITVSSFLPKTLSLVQTGAETP